MLSQISGLHHVTSMASDARRNNAFFTGALGLRRVKKTVNFDAPEIYHLYYGDAAGAPGTLLTYFPFPDIGGRTMGTGEVGLTALAVPEGSRGWWRARLGAVGVPAASIESFGAPRLLFAGPDGEELALVEAPDPRRPWTGGGVPEDVAIRGVYGASLRVRDPAATEELLRLMGYRIAERSEGTTRLVLPGGAGAEVIEIEAAPEAGPAAAGAGSVHHLAFATPDRAAQAEARAALLEAGLQVTPTIDRDYFWSIYFRTPGGVLFEIATTGPGFGRDEAPAHLGRDLKLPARHAHLRAQLEQTLPPLE